MCKNSKFLHFFDAVYQKKELNQYLLFANVEGHAEILHFAVSDGVEWNQKQMDLSKKTPSVTK